MFLFFSRRRWAIRVIKKAGLPIRSKEATVIIDMLIWASKQFPVQHVPVAERVLIAAMMMARNQTAIEELQMELPITAAEIESVLARLSTAAIAVATEYGMPEFARLHASHKSLPGGGTGAG